MSLLRTRTAALLLAIAGAFAAPSAFATEATDAQVDRLIQVMDMPRMIDDMFTQVDTMSVQMGEQFLGKDATPEQREAMRQAVARQQVSMRKTLSWDKLGPIYRNVYRKLFTAEEVDAMIAFYSTDTGRGILRKMPQAMELAMQDMQPMMQTMIADMQKALEAESQRSGTITPVDVAPSRSAAD